MKALLICDNQELKELLSFQITSAHPISVKECISAKEAVELLSKESMDLVISPYNGPDSVILRHLKERKDPLPVIFFFDPLIASPDPTALKDIPVIGTVEQSKLVEGVSSLLKEFLQKSPGGAETTGEFCPIRTNLLIRATPLKSDIYIRLSADKFIKLFKTGDEFDQNDLKKYYEAKGVEYMYLRRQETAEFIQKFRLELDVLLNRSDVKQEEAMEAAEMSHEAIHELVQRVGFTEEVQELAKKNVQLTLKAIGANPKLSELVDRVTKDGNYLSQHSTLLAHMSCCVAKELEWGSESTFSKLVLASFMHDISVNNPEMAKVNTMKEMEARKAEFSADEVKGYHLHPAKSADVVRTFKEIPSDVDVIVQQHHERPNGGGFPRGLAHNYIAPLSALFIVSHDLTQSILFQKAGFSLPKFVEEKKPFYNQGNFKKVLTALEKVKL